MALAKERSYLAQTGQIDAAAASHQIFHPKKLGLDGLGRVPTDSNGRLDLP